MAAKSLPDTEASGIYQIRNLVNGKRYIGSAKCFRVRWNAHRSKLVKGLHYSRHLQASWAKHGPDAFIFEQVELCPPDLLLEREQSWIDSLKPEFNSCPIAGSTLGRKFSAETRAKIGDSKRGKRMPPRSDSCRAALSAAHLGKPKPAHVMRALQEGRSRRVYTQTQRERISESLRQAYADGRKSREKTELHKHKIGMHYAKLSDDQVREIRKLRSAGVTGRELAKRFGSNPGTISEMCSMKRYRWVF